VSATKFNPLRFITTLLILAAIAGGGWWVWRNFAPGFGGSAAADVQERLFQAAIETARSVETPADKVHLLARVAMSQYRVGDEGWKDTAREADELQVAHLSEMLPLKGAETQAQMLAINGFMGDGDRRQGAQAVVDIINVTSRAIKSCQGQSCDLGVTVLRRTTGSVIEAPILAGQSDFILSLAEHLDDVSRARLEAAVAEGRIAAGDIDGGVTLSATALRRLNDKGAMGPIAVDAYGQIIQNLQEAGNSAMARDVALRLVTSTRSPRLAGSHFRAAALLARQQVDAGQLEDAAVTVNAMREAYGKIPEGDRRALAPVIRSAEAYLLFKRDGADAGLAALGRIGEANLRIGTALDLAESLSAPRIPPAAAAVSAPAPSSGTASASVPVPASSQAPAPAAETAPAP
jgi:hypothetical protein